MVLILKWGGEYHGIGLVEVVCKAVAVIINYHFTASIAYHKSLHRFRAFYSTGTAILNVKLIQKVAAFSEAVLHAIFLYLHKA